MSDSLSVWLTAPSGAASGTRGDPGSTARAVRRWLPVPLPHLPLARQPPTPNVRPPNIIAGAAVDLPPGALFAALAATSATERRDG